MVIFSVSQIPLLKPADPVYDPDELYGIASVDFSKVYDIREVIARVVDGSVFDEFKQLYGDTLVTGTAPTLPPKKNIYRVAQKECNDFDR